MNEHQNMLDDSRETKKTLYVVTAFYVAVGFALLVSSAVTGELLGTFLGFVIISGALAVTALLRAVLRIGLRVSALEERLDGLRGELAAWPSARAVVNDRASNALVEAGGAGGSSAVSTGGANRTAVWFGVGAPADADDDNAREACRRVPAADRAVDDATDPTGDSFLAVEPAVVARCASKVPAAATLDRDVFPRLMTASEDTPARPSLGVSASRSVAAGDGVGGFPPAAERTTANGCVLTDQGERDALLANLDLFPVSDPRIRESRGIDDSRSGLGHDSLPASSEAGASDARDFSTVSFATAVAARNLVREWKVVLRKGDLPAARRVYAASADLVAADVAARMGDEVEELACRTERSLRDEFARRAARRDFAGMVEVGERMIDLLPERGIAREAARLLPALRRKSSPEALPTP